MAKILCNGPVGKVKPHRQGGLCQNFSALLCKTAADCTETLAWQPPESSIYKTGVRADVVCQSLVNANSVTKHPWHRTAIRSRASYKFVCTEWAPPLPSAMLPLLLLNATGKQLWARNIAFCCCCGLSGSLGNAGTVPPGEMNCSLEQSSEWGK